MGGKATYVVTIVLECKSKYTRGNQVLTGLKRFGIAVVSAPVAAILIISTVSTGATSTASDGEGTSVLWSATLDVARNGPQLLGFKPGSGGGLSPTNFDADGASLRVKFLSLLSSSTLMFMITTDDESDDEDLADTDFSQPPTEYVLTVSGEQFAFDDAQITMNYIGDGNGNYIGGVTLSWKTDALNWSVGDQLTVTLESRNQSTVPTTKPNATPTDTPTPTATPTNTPTATGSCTGGKAVASPNANAGLVRDCETLLGFRDALSGDVDLNWSGDTAIRDWDGISLGGSPLRVTKIVLAYRWMTGIVPPELAVLDALEIINFTDSYLKGSIPSRLGGLSNLRELILGVNDLTGQVPPELGQLTNLEILDLGQNELTGPIPVELGNLTKMRRFVVGSNYMSGEIPQELTSWMELEHFVIDGNDFTGCAPPELRAPVHRLGDMFFCDELPDLWSSRPTFEGGIDLGVTFIERLPRYPIYKLAYNLNDGDCPYPYERMIGVVPCPGQEGVKRDPAPGETVELTAHVWNFGDEASGEFDYEWRSDGNLIESGTYAGLAAGERALFAIERRWPTGTSYPVITFTVDPDDEVSELLEDNNRVDDWIRGATIGIYFSSTSYASLSMSNEYGQTIQSPEHWVHRNAAELNRLLTEAGVNEKIRLEQFYITRDKYERNDIKWDFDGWWAVWHGGHFNLDTFNRRPAIDKGLLHEWLHQLGAIDMYWIPYRDDHISIPDANRPGQKAGCGPDYGYGEHVCFRFDEEIIDIMSDLRLYIGPHTAGGLKSLEGIRKSFYGTYLYETPETTVVKVVDESGTPIASAVLNFYQKVPVPDSPAFIDDIPEFSITTDESGLAVLPNRGVTGIENAAGHQLRPNPFGIVDVVGFNSIFLIEMVSGDCTDYEWLTTVELNLAYWDGQKERAEFTKTLSCTLPSPFHRYDADRSGTIDKFEVINAVNDYLFGEGDASISKTEMIEVINLYLFG